LGIPPYIFSMHFDYNILKINLSIKK